MRGFQNVRDETLPFINQTQSRSLPPFLNPSTESILQPNVQVSFLNLTSLDQNLNFNQNHNLNQENNKNQNFNLKKNVNLNLNLPNQNLNIN